MTDPVLTVNLLISVGLFAVVWCIWYILVLANNEEKTNSTNSHHSTSSDE